MLAQYQTTIFSHKTLKPRTLKNKFYKLLTHPIKPKWSSPSLAHSNQPNVWTILPIKFNHWAYSSIEFLTTITYYEETTHSL